MRVRDRGNPDSQFHSLTTDEQTSHWPLASLQQPITITERSGGQLDKSDRQGRKQRDRLWDQGEGLVLPVAPRPRPFSQAPPAPLVLASPDIKVRHHVQSGLLLC